MRAGERRDLSRYLWRTPNNMAKLFLHIGPHKTGSTYIQKWFFENRALLLNLGVNYPNVGIAGQYGHHETIEKVKTLQQKELAEYLLQFLGSDINFVSSENFDRLKQWDIKKLSRCLAKLDVRIIYYYRNYIDLLPSWWQEEVKHGSMMSFYEFVLPHVLRPFSSIIINPAVVLDLYANVFGKDNITVVDYDLAVKTGSILRPILQLLGVQLEVVRNEMVNASLNVEVVELIRALNTLAHFNNEWHFHKIRALFLRKMTTDAIASDVEHLVSAIRAHIKPLRFADGFFDKSVQASFKNKYSSRFFNNLLAEHPDREVLIPSDNWILKEDALEVCKRIYQHIVTGDLTY
jgi:hypothetical protein